MRERFSKIPPHLGIDHQVDVALPIARFDIGQTMPFFRQRPQTLGEQTKPFGFNRQFFGSGAKQMASDPDNVADVHRLKQSVSSRHPDDLFARKPAMRPRRS